MKEGLDIHTEQRVAVKVVSRVSLKSVENGTIIVKREVSLLRYLSPKYHTPGLLSLLLLFIIIYFMYVL